ncbi:MAG: PPC domain-containing protein [Bryobacteraceae bacterium]
MGAGTIRFLMAAAVVLSAHGRLAAAVCGTSSLVIGQKVTSSLVETDCRSTFPRPFDVAQPRAYAKRYVFSGIAGQKISITLNSPTMDTYLFLLGPAGNIVAEDDDGGGNLNSRIPMDSGVLTLPAAGTFTIEVTTYQMETGTFTLELSGDAPPTGAGPFRFVAVTPCRVADTRAGQGTTGAFGPPTPAAQSIRNLPIPSSACGIPGSARAYSLNITVVPAGPLYYVTVWPSGKVQPLVSTLNSFEGRIVANAAIVPAGADGSINVFVTGRTDLIVDINGYFVP